MRYEVPVYTGPDYQPVRSGDEKSELYGAVLSIVLWKNIL
jgi:hypothetical protein